ncbi:MAG: tryptophan synthase subunit alpha [Polyangiaceae bacterium]
MGRLEATFARLAGKRRKALVAYLCVGDPSADVSVACALACVRAGADVLELGVPFSDPAADGPAIAAASERALANGGGLATTLEAARRIRAETDVPIVLFGYYNPIFVSGEATVVARAADSGVDAFLVVDLPVDEPSELRTRAAARGLSMVPLLSPTTTEARLEVFRRAFATASPGFLYCVSVAGVTGSNVAPLAEATARAGHLRTVLGVPSVVGFGIDSPANARVAARDADGIVVGTAIVRALVEGPGDAADGIARVTDLVGRIRAALDGSAAA